MTYEQFLGEVPSYLSSRLPADTQIHIRTVLKNNDCSYDGLVICEPGNTVSPTIYLNGFYSRMQMGKASFRDVMDDVLDMYRKNRPSKDLDVQFFSDYEQVKSHIVYKLVSRERNQALLSDVPYVEYLDLAVVFQYLLKDDNGSSASILIHNSHCKLWKVTVEDLWAVAQENTPRMLPYVVRPMADVLEALSGKPMKEEAKEELEMQQIYVVSNAKQTHGAATMLYPNMLSEFAKCIHSDFFVVPSSIHELILLPANRQEDAKELAELITYVNKTQLVLEDVLADHPYYYCREDGKLGYEQH